MHANTFGRYRILGKLGEGGMAVVHMAEDPTLRRAVALKVMRGPMADDPEWKRRFHQEATTVARLGHHQIVQLYDSGSEAGTEYLVMEFLDRGSLSRLLQSQNERLDPVLAACVVVQAAEGLAAAHEAGVVHRDVKPDNILFSRQGLAKVADFGIARLQNDISHTRAGTAMGSPQFMAPEQIDGGEITGKTDVFALGGVLYRTLAGEIPFQADNMHAMLLRVISAEPRELRAMRPDCPKAISDLCKSMLRKEPAKRPSMDEVARQLRAWLSTHGVLHPADHLRQSLGFPQAVAVSGGTTSVMAGSVRRKGLAGLLDRARKALNALLGKD
jgi:serine/threonine-protein kinase